ncbi:hypothetical protein NIM87_10440 [Devosia sp. XJ19-1]|uniref:DUF2147 domain-containing protein n=1 Tax=Devosia ureilytica TaxID=2952754 RepID=A0A9Q4FRJ6_9HYPH|nr:hypothetical protein [Devosia ureilytica]MCP8883918.1 hypothetical protein [Devosia ureilytica]MCP8887526.1 hypothetical protein [Devosia ureilytica]
MRRFALCLALTALSATPALAQAYQGNWSCRDATTNRAGILTIYGEVYGWASRTANDPNSGTGSLTPYQDGVGFNDGNLRANGAIQAGRLVDDANFGSALQLETAEAIVMLCTPR